MAFKRKNTEADLRKYYTIFLEAGLIVTLLVFIIAAKINLQSGEKNLDLTKEQEVVEMEEVIQTKQVETPPPPRPPVPVEVPNDEILEDEVLNIDAELNLDAPLELPPAPPEEDEEDFFIIVENMPELIGGQAELQRKIRYPDMARKAGIEGMVIVQFIVNERGEVENPIVVRGIGGGCDEEAIRAVKESKFQPGRQRGNPVRVQMSLPVIFKLQN